MSNSSIDSFYKQFRLFEKQLRSVVFHLLESFSRVPRHAFLINDYAFDNNLEIINPQTSGIAIYEIFAGRMRYAAYALPLIPISLLISKPLGLSVALIFCVYSCFFYAYGIIKSTSVPHSVYSKSKGFKSDLNDIIKTAEKIERLFLKNKKGLGYKEKEIYTRIKKTRLYLQSNIQSPIRNMRSIPSSDIEGVLLHIEDMFGDNSGKFITLCWFYHIQKDSGSYLSNDQSYQSPDSVLDIGKPPETSVLDQAIAAGASMAASLFSEKSQAYRENHFQDEIEEQEENESNEAMLDSHFNADPLQTNQSQGSLGEVLEGSVSRSSDSVGSSDSEGSFDKASTNEPFGDNNTDNHSELDSAEDSHDSSDSNASNDEEEAGFSSESHGEALPTYGTVNDSSGDSDLDSDSDSDEPDDLDGFDDLGDDELPDPDDSPLDDSEGSDGFDDELDSFIQSEGKDSPF